MNLTKLDSSLRENLRNLLQGYVEHCEMSDSLMARIETPIYYHGFKFGTPVFTHRHPVTPGDRSTIGIAGINEPEDSSPSEIVLQIIEILSQKPASVGFRPVRLLPVANPVALELGEGAPSIEEWPVLSHLLEEFRSSAPAGFLEIATSKDDGFALEGSATPGIFRNIAGLSEQTRSLRHVSLATSLDDAWSLRLTVPARLSSGTVIAAARFATSLIRPD